MTDRDRDRQLFVAIFVCAAAYFLLLAAPSVALRDAGELTTAAFQLDVAHPTGFSLDLLFARVAMLLPFGDVAFRANCLMAIAFALVATFTAALSVRSTSFTGPSRVVLAVCSATCVCVCPTLLRAATSMEVYALSSALALFVLLQTTSAHLTFAERLRWLALAFGLSFGLHTTFRIGVLAAVMELLVRRPFPARRLMPWLHATALCVMAATIVLYLPVSSSRMGPVQWNDTRSFNALYEHLSASRIRAAFAYRQFVFWRVPEDLSRAFNILRSDMGLPVLALAVAGLWMELRSRRWALAVLVVVDLAYAVLLNPMGIADRQTMHLTMIGAVILAASGASGVCALLVSRVRSALATSIASVIATCFMPITSCEVHAGKAEAWTASEVLGSAGALQEVPTGGVVLCESDDLCGVSLFAQFVEGERLDLSIIPRQHLMNAAAWRRSRLGQRLRGPAPESRLKRLRWILSQMPTRVRWEMGEVLDERAANVHLAIGETPVLARVSQATTETTSPSLQWLNGRGGENDVFPQSEVARATIAHVVFSLGRLVAQNSLSSASELWTRALWFDPNHAGSWTNLAVVRATEGRLGEAIVLCERALAIDPDRLTAWRNLAKYKKLKGDEVGALAAEQEVSARTH